MFTLENPWLLLLLPIPWFIYRYYPRANTANTHALRIPFYQRVAKITPQQRASYPTKPLLLAYSIWALLVFAASGPEWLGAPLALPQDGRDIIIALDISGSMKIPDMRLKNKPVDRLTVVKETAKHFIQHRSGDRIGLILFGSRAYLQTPLTFDHKTVIHMLEDASVGLAGQQTAIGDAVGLAIKRLQKTPANGRLLILLTDGVNNAGILNPRQAADLAVEDNIKLYTIGLGAIRLVVPSYMGPRVVNPSVDLDEPTLKFMANKTGGLFFRATDTQALQKVYKRIDALETSPHQHNLFRPITPYYQWPLLASVLLAAHIALRKIRARLTC